MASFGSLVQKGLRKGLSRAEAEAEARDILFGDPSVAKPQPPLPPQPQPVQTEAGSATALAEAGFGSLDELWASLQQAWDKRGRGVELIEVLDEINSLLDRGVISVEQFQELMV